MNYIYIYVFMYAYMCISINFTQQSTKFEIITYVKYASLHSFYVNLKGT